MGALMRWYKFDSIQNFHTWHENLKNELGYPLPPLDQNGIVVEGVMTTDYTRPIIVSDTDIRALVEEQYANNLQPCDPPIFPELTYTVIEQN